jgi:glycine/D-amino acid oxidase-like deaminating enzyme
VAEKHVAAARRKGKRILPKRFQDHITQLAPCGRAFGDLHVVLGLRGLVAGGDAAVDPLGFVENLARAGELLGGEDVRNSDEHDLRK